MLAIVVASRPTVRLDGPVARLNLKRQRKPWPPTVRTGELAAQEAARQVALSTDFATGVAAADAIAHQIVVNHGWGEDAYQGLAVTGSITPGSSVTAAVTVYVPAIVVPLVGDVGGGFTRTWSHTEVVDTFREDR